MPSGLLPIDIDREIHYLKQEMKNRRHRRLQDLLFPLIIISFIGLIPALSSALSAGQAPDLISKKTIMLAQADADEEEDEGGAELPPVVTTPPQIKGVPPAQQIPPAQTPPVPPRPAPAPAAGVRPPEVKGEVPGKPAPSAPPAEAKPPEVKVEVPGQPVPPPAEAKPPEVKEEVPVRPTPPKPEKKQADVSFFFDDADVYEVIQTIFGEVLKVNYIVDPKIKGRVNFRTTTPIPKDEVLPVMEIILRLNGIAIVEEKGLYRIIAITDIAKEPAPIRFGRDPNAVVLKGIAIVQVVQLKYIGSTEMIKILTPLLSPGDRFLTYPRTF